MSDSDGHGLFVKVVGGGLAALAMGAMKSCDDMGRAAYRAGSHAIPIEEPITHSVDDGWRIGPVVQAADNELPATPITSGLNEAPLSHVDVLHENEIAPNAGATNEDKTVLEQTGEFVGDVVTDLAEEVVQEGAEQALEREREKLSDANEGQSYGLH